MHNEIRVTVVSYGEHRNLMLVYFDPITGKKIAKSSGTRDERAATKAAGKLEDELNSGRYVVRGKITWAAFRARYELEKVSSLASGTRHSIKSAMNHLERVVNPDKLSKLTPAVLSHFQSELRKPRPIISNGEQIMQSGMRETTIARHLRHIKAALNWAASIGLLAKCPKIEMPKRARGQTMMRGRPITAEEFERMLAAIERVRPQDARQWQRFLTGLWLSGLRLREALQLSWDLDAPFAIDLSGRRPVFRIYCQAEKGHRDRLLPMTPDFAEWLLSEFAMPERSGLVLKLAVLNDKKVSRIISKIGREAGVVVNKADGKFASAHDLRRAFATRWANKLKPATLQLLMRHESIETTLKFYVGQDAADVADELWANFAPKAAPRSPLGNTSGNTGPNSNEKPPV